MRTKFDKAACQHPGLRKFRSRLFPIVSSLGLVLVGIACNSATLDRILDATVEDISRFGPPAVAKPSYPDQTFVNFESPHVHPLDLTPDGKTLLAVNTPDNRLEVFDVSGAAPIHRVSIPVGLEPVSVRARDDSQAWVANHLSDSVSIVNLKTAVTIKTLHPGDEPTDVAFAGEHAFVVCSQINQVLRYALTDLNAAPQVIPITGEDPRMATVSADGKRLVVSIFESGNATTIVPAPMVSDPGGPYGGQNPPPNRGGAFAPAINGELPTSPKLAIIVRKDAASGAWLDDNGADWSAFVTWDVLDHDLAIIDVDSLAVSYVSALMTTDMAVAPVGDTGFAVVGTEALNQVRFEPNAKAHFIQSRIAVIAGDGVPTSIRDLNQHLEPLIAAGVRSIPEAERSRSLADPRGVIFHKDGQSGYVTGLGSNNVIRIAADGLRLGQLDVGQGPTGVVLDDLTGRLYVLNRFESSISTIDTGSFSETSRTIFHDPTPPQIRAGRPFLYDARKTSGLGTTACAACHIDGRWDALAWDLGDPGGAMKTFNQECEVLVGALQVECDDFHPLKGPMTTQTFQGIIGQEPLHWRGDRENLAAFNPAFVGLLGRELQLSDTEMAAFEAFVATLAYPPNPNRNPDNSLKTEVFGGNAQRGFELFTREPIDSAEGMAARDPKNPSSALLASLGPLFSCNRCHELPTGSDRKVTSASSLGREQGTKVPQLRNMHEKIGLFKDGTPATRGFGYTHTGEFPTIDEFLHLPNFNFGDGAAGDQKRTDVIAFVLSMAVDTHAGVGIQATLNGDAANDAVERPRLDSLLALADEGDVGLIAKGLVAGVSRGYRYDGFGVFQSDRAEQKLATADLIAAAGAASPITWTIVPRGLQTRAGIDRNSDGIYDGE